MDSSGGCPRFFNSCGESMQSKLDSPMPWIGMYVAAASAIISIFMAVDAFRGFKSKNFWLPSKCFSMNAFSLTLLAVAMKLPVDLTNQMLGVNEILARVSSLALMSIVMGNLMTSLGTMEFNDIMQNLAAMGTLVITIVVNVSIHTSQMLDTVRKEFKNTVTLQIYAEQIICTVFMFILLVMLCSCGFVVPYLRRLVDKEYNSLNERNSTKQVKWGDFNIDEAVLRDYWVNAKIWNPQFFIARSKICAASGAICLLIALTLLEAWIRMHFVYKEGVTVATSNYKWSINWILIIQSIGVGLGTIAPVFRWFVAAKFAASRIHVYAKELFSPYIFGVELLVEWDDAPLSLKTRNLKFRLPVIIAKLLVFAFYFTVQYVIHVPSRLFLLVSAACVKVILLCFPHDESSEEIDLACHHLLTEFGLATYSVKSICNEVDNLIEIGRKKQPNDLIKLTEKSVGFNGVKEFINQPILGPDDALNCWSLSIVILTSIAVQLPNIAPNKIDELLRGVGEGLYFVNLIEKSLNVNLERYRFRLGADHLWGQVVVSHECEGINVKRQSYEETRQALAKIAEGIAECDRNEEIGPESHPIIWDFGNMATRSILYICSAIINSDKDNDGETEEELFERISTMISDIISACLTNLGPLITSKCTSSAINEREKNVREAAILLGQTEEILETLQKRKLPGLDPEKAAHINEWRVFMGQNTDRMASMQQDSENPTASVSAASATIPQSNEQHEIEMES